MLERQATQYATDTSRSIVLSHFISSLTDASLAHMARRANVEIATAGYLMAVRERLIREELTED